MIQQTQTSIRGTILAYDSMAATAAAEIAQTRRVVDAEFLHAWHSQEVAQPGGNYPALRAEYLRRASIIDAAYEVAIEPHRQAFLNQSPGEQLPPFLQPGFKSFAEQLHSKQEISPAQQIVGTSTKRPSSSWGRMSYASRMAVAAISIVLVFVVVIVTTNLVSQSGGPTRAERDAANKVAVDNAVESVLGPNASQKAEGFNHAGNGVLFRWATDTEKKTAKKNCITGLSCFMATIEMNADCPDGIYIELKLKDGNGTVVGMANEKTPAMYKGDRGVFAITGAVKAPKAQLGKVSCH